MRRASAPQPSFPLGAIFFVAVVAALLLPSHVCADAMDPEQYDLNYAKGLLAFGEGQYEDAQEFFRKALAANPQDPEASYYLGQTLMRLKRYDDAGAVFDDMLRADPSSGRAHLGLGILRYNRTQYEEALTSLTAAAVVLPDDPLVFYYQGLTAHQLGRYQEARSHFQRAATLSPDLEPSARFYSGVGYYRAGDLDHARAEFEAVRAQSAGTELAEAAEEFLLLSGPAPRQPEAPKRWNLNFSAAGQYDTNVVLLPSGTQAPGGATGIPQQEDYVAVLYASGDYRFLQTDMWTAGVSYGFYQSLHDTLHTFNVQDHAPTVYVQRQFGPARLGAQYLFNYTMVGQEPFLLANAGQLFFTMPEYGGRMYTLGQFRYQYNSFKDDLFPGNSSRNGINYLAGLTQYLLYADNRAHARAGFVFDTYLAGAGDPATDFNPPSDWSYNGYRLFAGVALPPVYTVTADFGFEYYLQDYKNANSFSSLDPAQLFPRRDDIYVFSASLTKSVNKYFSVSFQYNYTRDDSNVRVYNYNRSVYSLSLNAAF